MNKNKFLILSSIGLVGITLACCSLLLTQNKTEVTKADLTLYRYNITMDWQNRTDVSFTASSGNTGDFYFKLVGVTPKGNPYPYKESSELCKLTTTNKNLVNFDSNEYICRFTADEIVPWHDVLTLQFDAHSDVRIGSTLTETSPHFAVVTVDVAYNDSNQHETIKLSMNPDAGYATGQFTLTEENQIITFYSVSINYSCSY